MINYTTHMTLHGNQKFRVINMRVHRGVREESRKGVIV